MAFLPDYLTIEKCTDTDEKVGFLIDITNIVPYILHPPIFILDKYDQQHQLISFLSKVYHKKTIDDKIKYKYIINSSMYVFPGLSEVDSIKKMINKLISLFIPFYNLNVPVPFKSLPKNNYISIPILRNPNNSFDILTCSQCSTFSIYIYDLYNQLFFCKNNKDHKMITIETKDRLINFHNICYLSCLKCNKLKIISSGLAVPNITSKRKDLNKILKNINMMNAYTQVCLSCSYVDKIICAICGLEHKNTIKKSWQKIKVFNYKKNYIETIHLCHKEKKIKNNDNRIWSYPLLLDLLK
jgi:transcription elongation factor Elf1